MSIRVLFGTETGNAEECAEDLGNALQEAGFPAEVIDLENFQPAELAQGGLVLMVTSTYGNGDPPYSAEALMKWLSQPEASTSVGRQFQSAKMIHGQATARIAAPRAASLVRFSFLRPIEVGR